MAGRQGGADGVLRDRWGRPLIVPPGESEAVGYTRTTTYVASLDDSFGLTKWKLRQVAVGLADRPDLAISASAHREDKYKLDDIAEAALEASQSSAKSNLGTAIHLFSEKVDLGQPTGPIPAAVQPDIEAYRSATAPLTNVWVERFVVNDELRVAGTPDRIIEYKGQKYIGDLKGLALDTKIPTPSGWTTMGEISVGDLVFDSQGDQCRVTAKSEVKNIGTYSVLFDDNTRVVCDTEHIWWTQSAYGRHQESFGGRFRPASPIGMDELIRTQKYNKQNVHIVPVAKSLKIGHRDDIFIDPYVLGCWLGDGTASNGGITKNDELFDVISNDGHALGVRQVDKRNGVITRTVLGLVGKLRQEGLLGHKHIPAKYIWASHEQRVQLLAGLMDTDGTWNIARQTAVFNSTNKELAYDVHELILTLGCRSHVAEYKAKGFGVTTTAYAVEYTPTAFNPFRLPAKRDKVHIVKILGREARRVIRSIDPGPNVSTVCIAVDSPDSTYLCSESMIPTHNTSQTLDFGVHKFSMQMAMYSRSKFYDFDTQVREDLQELGVSQDFGIITHLPSGSGQCRLYWVDLNAGWYAVTLATRVREWRQRKDLLSPLF